ncbi:MAG: hypothetical protein Q7R98_00770 [Candidatus Jorgensenbacteria bacterium]|nr:hypothetical protein [Candidatus Jorgensenbacteria bacterium]
MEGEHENVQFVMPPTPPVRKKTSWPTIVLIAIVAFVVGLGISWYVFGRSDEMAGEVPEISSTATSTYIKTDGSNQISAVASSGGNTIVVDNQSAGDSVVIQSVSFENPGWVAIHEERDGVVGNTLGAGWFPAGTSSGVIELLRGTVSGGTYYAVLHGDNGDKLYNYTTDKPITDASGSAIMTKFVAQ